MIRIFKDRLGIDGETAIIKGQIKRILTVMPQDGWPTVWYEVSDDEPQKVIEIVTIGTGWPMDSSILEEMQYIGSVIDGGGFVWHYYANEYEEL